ncbi:MAG: helix-turn-helix transcriptional regulator [Lachnospiraceae bacterium]|nr:helix-turn-helix transcriptional regulator [Lachnospiraceae bacterium]
MIWVDVFDMLVKDYKRIGDRIQQIRKQSGLSQDEAAWRAHMSLRAYADIERGNTNPRLGSILNICDVFHITPDMLLMEDEHPLSCDYSSIIEKIDSLPPDKKQAAYSILDIFFKSSVSDT